MGNIKQYIPLIDKKTFEINSDVNKIIKGTIYKNTLDGKIAFKAKIITTAHTSWESKKDVSLLPFKIAYPDKLKTIIVSTKLLKNNMSINPPKKVGISSGKLP